MSNPSDDRDDKIEDRRVPWIYLLVVILGMVLSSLRMPRFHSLLPGPLAYAIAIIAGVIFAALEAPTWKRQLAYSIPFILMMVGAIWMVQYTDTHSPTYLRARDIFKISYGGTVPGLILYFVVRILVIDRLK